ncbi:MAG: cytochrome-c peroxidase [Proteobacteria bacterium]|nr:cytochrome-c peroxidase [Pseudomonadota bacterium]MBU1737793.1 cytochrome-c peroxidase [Pseudomonadota bacterium]
MLKTLTLTFSGIIFFLFFSFPHASRAEVDSPIKWSEKELKILKSLQLKNLPPLPKDPSNKYSDNPKAAILGERIFYDTRFSANQKVACSNCHLPTYSFTDNLPLARGMATTARRSMPFIGLAYSRYFFWDGRKDSLWSQALGPPESAVEHGISRTTCATLIYNYYRPEYEEIFGAMPEINSKTCPTKAIPNPDDKEGYAAWLAMSEKNRKAVNRIFANMGKAIAAFVARIVPAPARFDHYVEAVLKNDPDGMNVLSPDEQLGLKLFIDDERVKCINCHRGPLFTNGVFHNIGVSEQSKGEYDRGRAEGIKLMQEDVFNCKGEYSDANPKECRSLNLVPLEIKETGEIMEGAFKTPSLRNSSAHPPYMHDGSSKTMMDVMIFYKDHSPQLKDQELTMDELRRLVAFMETLNAPLRILPFDR